ncbi:MAG: hypothetical protein U0414_20220 [Polyangiaceae bacterium]
MRRTLLIPWLILASTVACGGDSDPKKCTVDTECKGDRVCNEGACVERAAAPPAIRSGGPPITEVPTARLPWGLGSGRVKSALPSAPPTSPPPAPPPSVTSAPALAVGDCSILPDQPHGAELTPSAMKAALSLLPDVGCASSADARRLLSECQTSAGKQRVLMKARNAPSAMCDIAVRTFSFRVNDGRTGTWVHFVVAFGDGVHTRAESYIVELFKGDTAKLEYSGVTGASPACARNFDAPDPQGSYTATELRTTLKTAPPGLHDYFCTAATSYAAVPPVPAVPSCNCAFGPKAWGPCERTGCGANYYCVEDGPDRGYCVCSC